MELFAAFLTLSGFNNMILDLENIKYAEYNVMFRIQNQLWILIMETLL